MKYPSSIHARDAWVRSTASDDDARDGVAMGFPWCLGLSIRANTRAKRLLDCDCVVHVTDF